MTARTIMLCVALGACGEDGGRGSDAIGDGLVETDTAPEEVADTAAEVIDDAAPEETSDIALEEVADTAPEEVADTAPEEVADTAPDMEVGPGASPFEGLIVFNEILIDGATDGDPNGDGDIDAVADEFVEIANVSGEGIDLGGFSLVEETLPEVPRHVFSQGTTLAPGTVIVVFGGGTAPDDIEGARFVVANAPDPGIPFGLSLDNGGDTLTLRDAEGRLVATLSWGEGAPLAPLSDESWTRAPDLSGALVPHTSAAPGVIFSPGRRVDGSVFTTP